MDFVVRGPQPGVESVRNLAGITDCNQLCVSRTAEKTPLVSNMPYCFLLVLYSDAVESIDVLEVFFKVFH